MEKLIDKIMNAVIGTIYISIDEKLRDIDKAIGLVEKVVTNANNIFFIGNGGSAAIAIHMTADFMKNGGLNTISMYDPAILTCLGNDYGYEYVFSKQLEKMIKQDDVLIAISSSGNSKNIINAIDVAHDRGAVVISLTGFCENNICREKADYSIYVPSNEYGIVESVHNMFLQEVVDRIKQERR